MLTAVREIFVSNPKKRPRVNAFAAGREPLFVRQLRRVNVLTQTEMCRVMSKHGSDKGDGWHNYTTIYSSLFGGRRKEPLRIFELGLGTNKTNLVSNMGPNGRPGASLRGWREIFPHAHVYGADIDRDILFEEERIKTFYCDQLDTAAICDLWSQPELTDDMDIIIDDGLHTFEGNISFLKSSLQHLCVGGYYVIEDILESTISLWHNHVRDVYMQLSDHEFVFISPPHTLNNHDNNLLVIRRNR
jgi:hypothetical protein